MLNWRAMLFELSLLGGWVLRVHLHLEIEREEDEEAPLDNRETS